MSFSTRLAFLDDAYLAACEGKVLHVNERGGIILDATNFYATSGGQPGDTGVLERDGAADPHRRDRDRAIQGRDHPRARCQPAAAENRRAGRRPHRLGAPLEADAHAHRLPYPVRRLPLPDHLAPT